MKEAAVSIALLLVLVARSQTLAIWDPIHDLKTLHMEGTGINQEQHVGQQCGRYSDCKIKHSLCEDDQCVCMMDFKERDNLCVPETVSFIDEMDLDIEWDNRLLDEDSKEHKDLAKDVTEAIKNAHSGLGIIDVHPVFTKTGNGKVTTRIITYYLNDDSIDSPFLERNRRLFPGVVMKDVKQILNGLCTKNSDCDGTIIGITCSGTLCECEDTYVYSTANLRKCYKEKKLNEECTIEKQCVHEHETCDSVSGTCKCKDGFDEAEYLNRNNETESGCFLLHDSPNNGACTENLQCEYAFGQCIDAKCKCGNGYKIEGSNCVGAYLLKQSCTASSQCAPDYSECAGSPTICKCKGGYERNGEVCEVKATTTTPKATTETTSASVGTTTVPA